jgi:peptide/nickel transport system ATP-binding protein
MPALHAARDLPDLARYLWSSLSRGVDERTHALIDLSLRAEQGCLAVIGEEGSGKTALVLLLARVLCPSDGDVTLAGVRVHDTRARREVRRKLQIVLDDVQGGLDPRLPLSRSFLLWARALGLPRPERAGLEAALTRVGLNPRALDTQAAALSRGEVKRAAIARALLSDPTVLVLDEPTRGLDPVERNAVLTVLAREVARRALVVATRDVALARAIGTRVAVLSHGELIEHDEADRVFFAPGHELTKSLVNAAPSAPRPPRAS